MFSSLTNSNKNIVTILVYLQEFVARVVSSTVISMAVACDTTSLHSIEDICRVPKKLEFKRIGTVVNEANAVDGNPRTYSTLTNGTGPANEVTSQNLNG
jgi:hypothetical protein